MKNESSRLLLTIKTIKMKIILQILTYCFFVLQLGVFLFFYDKIVSVSLLQGGTRAQSEMIIIWPMFLSICVSIICVLVFLIMLLYYKKMKIKFRIYFYVLHIISIFAPFIMYYVFSDILF